MGLMKTRESIKTLSNVIQHAKGEYIHLFSDDDLYTQGTLAKILKAIRDDKPSAMCLNHFSFRENTKLREAFLPEKDQSFSLGQ